MSGKDVGPVTARLRKPSPPMRKTPSLFAIIPVASGTGALGLRAGKKPGPGAAGSRRAPPQGMAALVPPAANPGCLRGKRIPETFAPEGSTS